MAVQAPLKAVFDENGNVVALGQYTSGDFIGITNGGTGSATFGVGNILVTNGTNSMQEVGRSSIIAGNSAVTVTGGSADSLIGGSDVLISFNVANLDISTTSGFLPSNRIQYVSADTWDEADVNHDLGEESF
jgi:hypothetical protein